MLKLLVATLFTAATFFPSPFLPSHKEFRCQDQDTCHQSVLLVKHPLGGHGTGFFISQDGYLITNYHVAKPFEDIGIDLTVITPSREKYKAKILKMSKEEDLALAKVEKAVKTPFIDVSKINYKRWDTYTLHGNGRYRYFYMKPLRMIGDNHKFRWERLFTTGITPGDSGGPILDSEGHLIGVGSAFQYKTKNTMAVPAEDVKKFVDDYFKENGKK